MTDDEISRFDNFVATSSSPHELMVKSMVGGLDKILTIDDCINFLIDRIFDIRRKNQTFSREDYLDHSIKILEKLRDRDVIYKNILNKSRYSSIVIGILQIIRKYFSLFISQGGNLVFSRDVSEDFLLTEFIRYSMVVSSFDMNFIPRLKDEDGNNLLMIISITAGFEEGERLISRTGIFERGGLENYIEKNPIAEVLWALSKDIGCDIYCKNNKGRCFADFFSLDFLEKIGLPLKPTAKQKI